MKLIDRLIEAGARDTGNGVWTIEKGADSLQVSTKGILDDMGTTFKVFFMYGPEHGTIYLTAFGIEGELQRFL